MTSLLAKTCLLIFPLLLFQLVAETSAAETASELRRSYQQLVAKSSDQIQRPETPEHGELLYVVANQYAPHSGKRTATDAEQEYAGKLFKLAQQAAAAGQPSLAFQWVTEVVVYDPDHVVARRILGYELADGQWQSAYSQRMAKRGLEWSRKYGWIKSDEIGNYEAGQRRSGKNWITLETDTQRRKHIKDGWHVRTDHFSVTTNHSLEAGAELAGNLEQLYQVWRQLFAGFYLGDREVKLLFTGDRNARQRSKPYRVIYHITRDQYNRALVRRQPQIAETLGIYFDTHLEAHFFAGDDQSEGTLYHEAVHQLFQESRQSARHIGAISNFWAIEGVATYFESLQRHQHPQGGDYYTIGQPAQGRLPAARERVLSGEFYLPLAELVQMGKTDLQQHPQRASLYSETAGLTTFLMQADGGCYREPFVEYLATIYAGRDDPGTLASLVGVEYRELDKKYLEFLESLP